MDRIVRFGQWAQENWLALVIILSVIMMTFLCLILCSWLFGYWSNALRGTHFELMSCWSGVTAVAGGLAGIVGLAKAAWTKVWHGFALQLGSRHDAFTEGGKKQWLKQ